MKGLLVALLVAGALLFAGCISQPQQASGDAMMEKDSGGIAGGNPDAMDKPPGEAMDEGAGEAMDKPSDGMMDDGSKDGAMGQKENDSGSMMGKEDGAMMGSSASYVPYDADAYRKALSEGKVVYLEFYAAWCPDCRAYEPRLNEAFARMAADGKYDGVAGFKVNFDTQEDLKREFGIVAQHTHVIIGKDGQVAVKSREVWSIDELMAQLESQL